MNNVEVTTNNIESHPIPGTLSWIQLDLVAVSMANTTTYTYSVYRAADYAASVDEAYFPDLPSRTAALSVASLLHREALCRSSHN